MSNIYFHLQLLLKEHIIIFKCIFFTLCRSCEAPLSEFVPKINSDHTSECLKRLLYIYQLQRQEEDVECDETQRDAQIQMESCQVIFSLGAYKERIVIVVLRLLNVK